ncbi:MAG: NYN domain-containing protein [Pseudomonas sp.]
MASKPNAPRHQKHFAVLIDADNASAAIGEGLFQELPPNDNRPSLIISHDTPQDINKLFCTLKNKKALAARTTKIIDRCNDEEGWARLAVAGSIITKLKMNFGFRPYRFRNPNELVKHYNFDIELQERDTINNDEENIYVKTKESRPAKLKQRH